MRNTVHLPDDISRRIVSLAESGRFDDANDVLREGLRLVEEKAAGDADKLQALRQAADLGFADLDQGRFNDVPVEKRADHIARIGWKAAQDVGNRARDDG
ncbi:ribbon-helix-helix domain-containing protein [Rhizobium glycinendophyticum]|uniref:Type II toxin-antitoxin system ParD family antitoxin n=1 Tax=Rhizobium glycinendophyticum TaxID=2589807 RepID=A0A504UNF0_9HYPH|nr:type II toxin-antitoxin system ParD family antitoxin [Rhizobium glycinendophyticum]TPP06583.1 type II toxin-antitoxin system ParD family antitoxin [Rhizobium glycinendophyticum]